MDGSIADSTMLRMRSGMQRLYQPSGNSSSQDFFEELLRIPVAPVSADQATSESEAPLASANSQSTPAADESESVTNQHNDDSSGPVADEAAPEEEADKQPDVQPVIIHCFAPQCDVPPPIAQPQLEPSADGLPYIEQPAAETTTTIHADQVPILEASASHEVVRDLGPIPVPNQAMPNQELSGNQKPLHDPARWPQRNVRRDKVQDVPSDKTQVAAVHLPQQLEPATRQIDDRDSHADSDQNVDQSTPAESTRATDNSAPVRDRRSQRVDGERDKWYANAASGQRDMDSASNENAASRDAVASADQSPYMQAALAQLEKVSGAPLWTAAGPLAAAAQAAAAPNALSANAGGAGTIGDSLDGASGSSAIGVGAVRSGSTAGGSVTATSAAGGASQNGAGNTGTGQGQAGQSGLINSGSNASADSRSTTASGVGLGHTSESQPQSESRQLSQQERVRLVQRVARSFSRIGPDGGQVSLKLHPPELGVLNVSIKIEGQSMTARLQTESSAARDVILESLPVLKERLNEQGIEVEKFQVDVGSSESFTGGQSQMNDTSGGSARGGQNDTTVEGMDNRRTRRGMATTAASAVTADNMRVAGWSVSDRTLDVRA